MQIEKLMKSRFIVFLICIILTACDREAGNAPTPIDIATLPIRPSAIAHTPTPAPAPTETWLPPLSESQAEERMMELLQNNGGCRLPCFLGIVPGETEKEKIFQFLNAFQNIGSRKFSFLRNNSIIEIFFTIDSAEDTAEVFDFLRVFMTAYRIEEIEGGTVDDHVYDNPSYLEYFHYYSLPELLSDYGPPSSVMLSVNLGSQQSMGGEDLLLVFLDYSELGWNVSYRMPLELGEESYVGCPAQAFISMALWLPGDERTAAESTSWIEGFHFLPVEEAISINVDEFYQQFKDPANPSCLETAKDVWPWTYK